MRPDSNVTFTTPRQQHLHQVADLRWDWAVERDRPPLRERDDFAHEFERWCEQHRTSHQCIVALNDNNQVVGFGFAAITPRVPAANLDNDRVAAEIQAVFVAPDLRNDGIGAQLIEHMINLARQRRAERVTVHSSSGAVSTYHRAGFATDPLTMSQTLHRSSDELPTIISPRTSGTDDD